MSELAYDYNIVEPKIRNVLYSALGQHLAIGTEEVDDGKVFVKVIAESFNGMKAKDRQARVWHALESLGSDAHAVSFVLAFGTDEV